jgi:hypothetical protein
VRELKQPLALWRVLATPVFLLTLGYGPRSSPVWGEISAAYCPLCRRNVNACLLFVVFMTGAVISMMLMAALGVMPLHQPK